MSAYPRRCKPASQPYNRNRAWDTDPTRHPQWDTLNTDLAKAQSVLSNVNDRTDPHLYFVVIEIARGQPDARPVLDQLYSSAIRAFPSYFHYYSQRVNLLQERWYGKPGEIKSYAASLLQSPGGDSGLVAYAYVTYNLMQFNERPTLLQVTGLSWPTIKLAYATREKLFGLRNRDWNALLNLSLAAIDPVTAKAALSKISGQWDPAVWGERQYFDSAVSWTLQSQK